MKPRVFVAWTAGLWCFTAFGADSGTTKPMVRINLDEQPAAPGTTAGKTTGTKTSATKATAQATPAGATGVKKDAKPAKKDEAPPKIDGLEVSRGNKGYLGVKVENNTFKVSFYDAKKKPVSADVAQIALRWPVHYQPNPERALLTPTGDGKAMTSDKTVRPPFSFKLFVTLLKESDGSAETPAESYVIDFQQ